MLIIPFMKKLFSASLVGYCNAYCIVPFYSGSWQTSNNTITTSIKWV